MQEIFYEESASTQSIKSAKTKYVIGKTISIISYVLAVIWFIFAFNFLLDLNNILSSSIFSIIPLALFIISGIVLGKQKDKFYVDYDYTLVTGSIRFSKVINNIKRKPIIQFDCSDIIKIGKYGSANYENFAKMPDYKKHILTSNITPAEGKDFYFITCAKNSEKYLFLLECSELFIKNILKFANRTVVAVEDFK